MPSIQPRLWRDKATGIMCFMGPSRTKPGMVCGYVGVTKWHPWWLKQFFELIADIDASGFAHEIGLPIPDRLWWLGDDAYYSEQQAIYCVMQLAKAAKKSGSLRGRIRNLFDTRNVRTEREKLKS